MRDFKLYLIAAFLLILGACDTTKKALDGGQTDVQQARGTIEYLASDELEGRETGTVGEEKAAAYIVGRLDELGVRPAGENGGWYQSFTYDPHDPHGSEATPGETGITGKNVIGYIDHGAESTIVIGGHYDHLGYGHSGSLHAGDPAIHNGADDNASGIAGLLELAERLVGDHKESNYLLIAFSGEEKGLWGSSYFVKNPTIDLEEVSFMINMDMIGRLEPDRGLAVNGVGTSPVWKNTIENANEDELKLVLSESGVGPSDHTSFYYADIPVLQFFTGQHEDYHKPSDDPDKINYDGLVQVVDLIYHIIGRLHDEGQIAFTKTAEEEQQTAARFSVTLGVLPDYLYDGKGLRIDGVKEGRPADKAGLVKGDIVIKMGDMEIGDIYDYMEALGKYEEGDTIVVEVMRGEEVVTANVTF